MQSKGYFSLLFVILALIGISWEHTSKPNQEVVVQFNSEDVSCDDTQSAIALVKLQLQDIGVENIQVIEGDGGVLKITYYSNVAVSAVKQLISSGEQLALSTNFDFQDEEFPELPTNNNPVGYELNVSEIHHSPDSDLDADGYILELKSNHDRYVPPVVYYAVSEIDIRIQNNSESVAYVLYGKRSLLIDRSTHNIPEVRAGPSHIRIS